MGTADRPLILQNRQENSSFYSFLSYLLSSFLAIVFAWRIIFYKRTPETSIEDGNVQRDSDDTDAEMSGPSSSSVLSLLSTDNIPESSSSGEDRPPPPPPQLLATTLPAYLDTINEEESDDLRSVSSASFASPRTIIDSRTFDKSNEQIDKSLEEDRALAGFSDSDYRSPLAKSPYPDSSIDSEAFDSTVEVLHPNPTVTQDFLKKKSDPLLTRGLLKELARLGQDNQFRVMADDSLSSSSERSIISQVAKEMVQEARNEQNMSPETDADRDQDEELVYNEDRRKTQTMDDNLSLNSVSINLNATRDSLLNQSITSNPIDESSIMENTILHRPTARPPSPPTDLPPPPPDLQIPIASSSSFIPKIPAPILSGPPLGPPPVPPPPPPKISPLRVAPPPPSLLYSSKPRQPDPVQEPEPFRESKYATSLLYSSKPRQPDPVEEPEPFRESKVFESTSSYSTKTSNIQEEMDKIDFYADRADQGMSSPPAAAPPPPPQFIQSYEQQSGFSSREDLLSDHAPSRANTVREIPVHRAPSAVPSTHSTVMEYRMPSSYVPPLNEGGDEYYRREVVSRTIITRSTDALSQPPLGRSSPIERYITYPDPNTREERTVDYKVTHYRNIEEEERRIREDQDRRKQEEEDRRKRDEESRRQWEMRERELLERLRRERSVKEREVEKQIEEREKLEKERIERDRIDRERAEMLRRQEWERREGARRGEEEDELARKRMLEKEILERQRIEEERKEKERLERERERLERERLEAEKKETERLERIRIERERIERERIEIERIERIKRERIEREKQEREKEKEDLEKLRREKEELERIERERRELEIEERRLKELAIREERDRERQRLEDEAKEQKRREEERREAELLADIGRQAEERERIRRMQEREEMERLERIRREQQRIEMERVDAERRERERMEDERRDRELLEAQLRQKEKRERERLEDIEREHKREEEERLQRERMDRERRDAVDRERLRRSEEEAERQKILDLERAAQARKAARMAELDRDRDREELDRKAREITEMERRENERRDRERIDEERSMAELRDRERRNQEIRDRERAEAAEREAHRRVDERKSRDRLDILVRERTERERFEAEKRHLLAEKEAMNRKKHGLTSADTLAKLTRPAYFSRENLTNPEFTTKIERQVIEKVDRSVWVDDYRYPSSQNAIQYSLDSTNDDVTRDRLYNPNELGRTGSSRSRQYRDRAKIEKARRDFILGGPMESSDHQFDRYHRSTDDVSIRGRPEYRGPLLQKFHEGEFKSKTDLNELPYSRVGPSEYSKEFERLLEETERKYAAYRTRSSQPNLYSRSRHVSTSYLETNVDSGMPDIACEMREVEETNLDEVHRRSGSVVDYNRMSRRDVQEAAPTDHTRSRSADYLMDRRLREETEPPENQLQKMNEHSPRASQISEHEMRFRKSTEKLTVPDWYRENRPTARPTDVDATTLPRDRVPQPSGYDSLPRGMFDKYRQEIVEMRRSQSSLHQIGHDHRQASEPPTPAPRRSLSQEVISSVQYMEQARALPGYTVSEIPQDWNMNLSKGTRVIEVADTFAGPKKLIDKYGNVSVKYGGRVTIEEVLDSIFEKTEPVLPRHTERGGRESVYQGSMDSPGIYTKNYGLMDKVMKQPEMAETLLQSEQLFVRCSHCHRTKDLSEARFTFVSCKHCYAYYCSRECRKRDWPSHSNRCSFARINTVCKDVIMKVREDPLAQACMSRIARDGFQNSGRGSVNIRLHSPQLAQAYVLNGWSALSHIPAQNLLYYYTISALISEKKEPSLIALCKKYDPTEKFILSVSIIADIENCPETPPPETVEWPYSPYGEASPQQDQYSPQSEQQLYNPYSPITLVPTDV